MRLRGRRMPSRTVVRIGAGRAAIHAELEMPESPAGLVLCTGPVTGHGDRAASAPEATASLVRAGYAVMRAGLVSPAEAEVHPVGGLVWDLGLLARRLVRVVDWLGIQAGTRRLPLGVFASGVAAGAALVAAARRHDVVRAVVCGSGRPELAAGELARVRAPTLLLVGELDGALFGANSQALRVLGESAWLRVVPGASRDFTEPDALDLVASCAIEWFDQHLDEDGRFLDRYLTADDA
jgi:dienelactone hydrolase